MQSYFNPVVGLHHYRSMAVRTLEENLEGERIGIKKLFYVLRPLLACRWIERKRSQPPTLFHAMTDDELVSPEERIWIEGLLKRKADACEAAPVAVNDARVNCIRAELERYGSMSTSPAALSSGSTDELDGLLRRWVVIPGRPCFDNSNPEASLLRRETGCNRLHLKGVIAIKLVADPGYQMRRLAPNATDCPTAGLARVAAASPVVVMRPLIVRPDHRIGIASPLNFPLEAMGLRARGQNHALIDPPAWLAH
jgi:hypothetical protein